MLKRKKEQGYEDITYSEFALDNLEEWNRVRDDAGGKVVLYDPATDTASTIAVEPIQENIATVIVLKNHRTKSNCCPL